MPCHLLGVDNHDFLKFAFISLDEKFAGENFGVAFPFWRHKKAYYARDNNKQNGWNEDEPFSFPDKI